MDTVPIRWIFLPYCIKRLADGRYIILNRRYKPLGKFGNEWVIYETDPSAANIEITPAIAKKLSCKNSDDVDVIYLYSDACIPTDSDEHLRSYSARLSVLMQLGAVAN
jgi:hypothetical protein